MKKYLKIVAVLIIAGGVYCYFFTPFADQIAGTCGADSTAVDSTVVTPSVTVTADSAVLKADTTKK